MFHCAKLYLPTQKQCDKIHHRAVPRVQTQSAILRGEVQERRQQEPVRGGGVGGGVYQGVGAEDTSGTPHPGHLQVRAGNEVFTVLGKGPNNWAL